MATITSNGTGGGLASNGASWAGGIVPTSADVMVIASTDTITLNTTGVVCESLSVSGVLDCVDTVDTAITIENGAAIEDNAHVNLDTSGNPSVTCKFLYNNAGSTGQVDAEIKRYGQVTFKGAAKTRHSGLVTALTAGATSLEVVDASGWLVGDEIIIESTDDYTYPPHIDRVVVSAIAGNVVTVPALSYDHEADCRVGNLSSNMVVGAPTTGASARMAWSAGYMNNNVSPAKIWDNVQFLNGGEGNYRGRGPLSIGGNSNGNLSSALPYFSVTNSIFIDYRDFFFYSHSYGTYAGKVTFKGNVAFTTLSAKGVGSSSGNMYTLDSCALFGAAANSTGVNNTTYNNEIVDSFISGYTYLMTGVLKAVNTVGRCATRGVSTTGYNSSLVDCTLHDSISIHTRISAVSELKTLDSYLTPDADNISSVSDGAEAVYVNIDGSETGQAIFRPFSEVVRDNVEVNRGASSLKITPTRTGADCIREQKIIIGIGETLRFIGYVKAQSAFYNSGSWTPPTVTISGLGLTPVVFTASALSHDDWEKYDISITNTSGEAGSLLMKFGVIADSALGSVWFDGIPTSPFITKVRHYGFVFNESSAHRTVNNYVVATEATASGYSATIDEASTTISTAQTAEELYDYVQYWAVQPDNVNKEVPYITYDGVNYILGTDWSLSLSSPMAGGLNVLGDVSLDAVVDLTAHNINGILTFTTAGTYTLNDCTITEVVNTSGGAVTLNLINGAVVSTNTGPSITILNLASLTLTGLQGGSEVRVYAAGTTTELAGVENSGTTFTDATISVNSVDIVIHNVAYEYQKIEAADTSSNLTLPIQQRFDRNYSNG
jgi:hypothetical protein